MSGKKVAIKKKPRQETLVSADAWVENRNGIEKDNSEPKEPMKRLTLDIPDRLHRQIKAQSALEGVTMASVLRKIMEEHFAL